MQCRNTKKTLTPVRSTGILICLAIAVSLATLAWMNGLPTPNIQTEDLQVTNYQLGSNFSFVDVTLYNNGTQSTKIKSITVDSQPTTVAYIDGSDQINLGESAVVRIANAFAPEEEYKIEIQTSKGSKFIYTVTA
jgi:archaellum component FlaF (FlaF/FlaG flagellin family)